MSIKQQLEADKNLKDEAESLLKQIDDAKKMHIRLNKEDYEVAGEFFSQFKDAIVLVGPVDETFQDIAPTPFDSSPVPKVGVHGNLIKTMLSGKYIKRLGIGAEMAGVFGLGFLMIVIGFYSGPMSTIARPVGILLQIIYVAVAFWLFKNSHLVVPIVGPVGSALTTTFVGLAIKLIIEEKAKGRITGMFGSYVSSDLVEQMVESGEEPSLGGEEQKITAYFSDVQAFSAFSELLSPTGLVDLMNEYLTAMTDILQEERGTLDKYIGDAIVAMYGAPIPMHDHAYQGVKTAVLMQKRQLELREKWKSEGDKWPDIVGKMQTRIGLNTGTATVGNMGSTDRFNYTMMGDMVNLAARSESGAKAYGAYIMITEDTKRTAEEQGKGIAYRYLDKIVVKGRTQPVEMYEVTDFWDDLSQDSKDCLDLFQQGIDSYLKQDWNKSLDLFERAKELEPNKPGVTPGVKDNPSMILIDRVKSMKDNPPGEDWDGVYVMTSK
ncbi:MAG: CHASE2 domain-containing protein [Opitutae bacterium]|nr:CHASE2 domain-containing protein [Opitutae bacterium]